MAFQEMSETNDVRRMWGLKGFPATGKSMFLLRMKPALLPIDADHRIAEILRYKTEKVLNFSQDPANHNDPLRIVEILDEQMPNAKGVGTIALDSATSIIQRIISVGQLRAMTKAGTTAQMARAKAIAITALQETISSWGTDAVWVWHMKDGADSKGNPVISETLSDSTVSRLKRNLNAIMQTKVIAGKDKDKDRYCVTVDWARDGRHGFTVFDSNGYWTGMPEILDMAMYMRFNGVEEAIQWGATFQGKDVATMTPEYQALKDAKAPKTAGEMWLHWIFYVLGSEYTLLPLDKRTA